MPRFRARRRSRTRRRAGRGCSGTVTANAGGSARSAPSRMVFSGRRRLPHAPQLENPDHSAVIRSSPASVWPARPGWPRVVAAGSRRGDRVAATADDRPVVLVLRHRPRRARPRRGTSGWSSPTIAAANGPLRHEQVLAVARRRPSQPTGVLTTGRPAANASRIFGGCRRPVSSGTASTSASRKYGGHVGDAAGDLDALRRPRQREQLGRRVLAGRRSSRGHPATGAADDRQHVGAREIAAALASVATRARRHRESTGVDRAASRRTGIGGAIDAVRDEDHARCAEGPRNTRHLVLGHRRGSCAASLATARCSMARERPVSRAQVARPARPPRLHRGPPRQTRIHVVHVATTTGTRRAAPA